MNVAQEDFYSNWWQLPTWSTATPNHDEKVRWTTISEFLSLISRDTTGITVLDLGCGRGWLTNLISQTAEVIGVDPVAGAVEYARRLFPQHRFILGGPAEAVVANGNRKFDIVVCSEVVEHIPYLEQKKFLHSIAAAMRPGGYLILTTPRGEWLPQARVSGVLNQPIEDWLTGESLTVLIESEGYTIQHRRTRYVSGHDYTSLLRLFNRRPARILRRLPGMSTIISRYCDRHGIYQIILARKPNVT